MTRREFYEAALKRLEDGYAEYGDKSFFRPTEELVREVTEELLDVAVWLAIMMSAPNKDDNAEWAMVRLAQSAQRGAGSLGAWAERINRNIGGTQVQAAEWLKRALEIE